MEYHYPCGADPHCQSPPSSRFKLKGLRMVFFLSFIFSFLLLPQSLKAQHPEQTYPNGCLPNVTPASGTATIDGLITDWNLQTDFLACMFEAGDASKDLLSKAYMKSECINENEYRIYVLVLMESGEPADQSATNAWVKIYDIQNPPLVNGNSGADFAWLQNPNEGYEATFTVSADSYARLEIHINSNGRTSSTGKRSGPTGDVAIDLELPNCLPSVCQAPPDPNALCTPPTSYDNGKDIVLTGNTLVWDDNHSALGDVQDFTGVARITGTGTVLVPNDFNLIFKSSSAVLVIDGPDLIINGGNFQMDESGSRFIMNGGALRIFGNFQQTENTVQCITGAEIEVGDEDADDGFTAGQFNDTGNNSSSSDWQNDGGYRYLKDNCINVTHDYQLQSTGTGTGINGVDVIINNCIEIGDRGRNNATPTEFGVADGDDSGNWQSSNRMYIFGTDIIVANGDFQNSNKTMTVCDVDVKLNKSGNFQINSGTLEGDGLCIAAEDAIENSGTWSANVTGWYSDKQNSIIQNNPITGTLPASESNEADILAACFTECCTGDVCTINDPVITVQCDDNDTPTDPSDDTFTYTIEITSGAGSGSGFNISGNDTQTGVAYDAQSAAFGPFNIADGNLTLTITDATDGTCQLADVIVTAPATCSNECEILDPTINVVCNNNGTPTDPSDDTFTYTIEIASGPNSGSTFDIIGGDTQNNIPYDAESPAFGPFNISSGNLTLTVVDGDDSNCRVNNVMVMAPSACSDECEILTPTINVVCDDNDTPDDTSDDTFTYTIEIASGPNSGASFNISVGDTQNGVAYDTESTPFGPFNIANGNLILTITDGDDPTCQLTNVTVTAPNTCSLGSECELSALFLGNLNCLGGNCIDHTTPWTGSNPDAYPSPLNAAEQASPLFFGGSSNLRGTDASYATVVGGDFIVPVGGGAENESRLAVGGNLVVNKGYGISESGGGTWVVGAPGSFGLAVEGNASGSGNVTMGFNTHPANYNVQIGGTNTLTIGATVADNQGNAGVNIASMLTGAQNISTNASNTPSTGSLVGNTLTGTNAAIEVFNVTAASLPTSGNVLNFADIAPGATIVVNISGTTPNINFAPQNGRINDPNNGASDDDAMAFNVVWNFFEATSIILDNSLSGVLLAPSANVTLNGNWHGRIFIGGSLTHAGGGTEIHNYPFVGDLSSFCEEPIQCSINQPTINVVCDDNDTPTDPSDDTFTYTIEIASGASSGATFNISGGDTQTGVAYDAESAPFGPFNIADGNLTLTITDSDDGTCQLADVTVTAPASCSDECEILDPTINVVCDDNDTPTDPSDDTFTYTIEIASGPNSGASFNISGGDTQTGVAYDAESASFGPFNIADGNLTLTITDSDDGTCQLADVTVTAPASCSDECEILDPTINVVCDDNDTPTDPSDDTFTYTIEIASGPNSGASFNISGGDTQTGVAYDAESASFGPFNIADGNLTLTITDSDDGTCQLADVTVTAPASCSDECEILDPTINVVCDDNDTPTDPSDDTFTYTIEIASGPNSGASFNISGGDTQTGVSYDAESASFGPFNIADGNLTLTITDSDDGTCQLADVTVTAPAACSDECEILDPTINVVCDDNDTPTDPSDDTFTYTIEIASGPNSGASFNISGGDTQTGVAYDAESASFGPFNIADGNLTLTITDSDDGTCQLADVTVTAPAACSDECEILDPTINVVCDDNDTPTDPSDDTFTYTIEIASGPNSGASFNISGGDTQTGVAYDAESAPFGPFNIADGNLTLTITDSDDGTCQLADVTVTAPAACSDECEILDPTINVVCDDNDTANPDDDTFTYTIEIASGPNSGATFNISGGDTQTGVAYDAESAPFGPFNIADGNLTLTITDADDATCKLENVTVTAPASCSPDFASLGDYVWEDLDRDGIQEDGEPAVEGVTVYLYTCIDGVKQEGDGPVDQTTTNNAGFYEFTNLEPGEYCVRFDASTSTDPDASDFVFTVPNSGDADEGTDSDVDENGETTCITLESGEHNPDIDAGVYLPASLGDYVWEDLDRDGIQEDGEPAVEGVTVYLYTCIDGVKQEGDGPVDQTTTNNAGFYEFTNLEPGEYCVRFDASTSTDPDASDFVFTVPNSGDADEGTDSDVDENGETTCITLESGEHNPDIDAGVYLPASLGDYVWEDLDRDGIQDDGEPAVEGVTVYLYTCIDGVKQEGDGPVDQTTTNNAGFYEFTNLEPGEYCVRFDASTSTDPDASDFVFTVPNSGDADEGTDSDVDENGETTCITLESGEHNPDIDAGVYADCELEITCPADITISCDESDQPENTGTAEGSFTCEGDVEVSFQDEIIPGNCANEKTIIRTWTAVIIDTPFEISCEQRITVEDNTAPVLNIPDDARFECTVGNAGTATATDNCDLEPTVTSSDVTNLDNCGLGTITRTWTATDACGNSTSADQIITIGDNTAPEITCPADVRFACEMGESGMATATDNCDNNPLITSSDETDLDECGLGTITRTWTATDCAGNSASCVQIITIYDDEAPEIVCPADVRFECEMGESGVATATDNCDNNPLITSSDETNLDECGLGTITRTWTATDCAGNSSSCVQIITIYDDEAPEIVCPADVSFACEMGESGMATATDNCDNNPLITSSDETNLDECGLGTITRTWTATDCAGNSSSCVQIITIYDDAPPVLVGVPDDTEASCDDIPEPPVVTAMDNCDETVEVVFTETDNGGPGYECEPRIITRTWTATDCAGNEVSDSQVITITDCEQRCDITALTAGEPECDYYAGTYDIEICVEMQGNPLPDVILVELNGNGRFIEVPLTCERPFCFTLEDLPADGREVKVFVSLDEGCTFRAPALFRAPECRIECDITGVTLLNGPECQGEGTYGACLAIEGEWLPLTAEEVEIIIGGQTYTPTTWEIVEGGAIACLTGLPANGNPRLDVHVRAGDDCSFTARDLIDAPTDCTGPVCNISTIEVLNATCGDPNPVYDLQLQVTYENEPAAGMLNIMVDGVLHQFAITGSPQIETIAGLTPTGLDVDVSASFSTNPNCYLEVPALYTSPDCGLDLPCVISGVEAISTTCVDDVNYDLELQISYGNVPVDGTLDVMVEGNLYQFAITGSPQTETIAGLPGTGLGVDVSVSFSNDIECSWMMEDLYLAPDCTPEPCDVTDISVHSVPECNEDGTYNICFFVEGVGLPMTLSDEKIVIGGSIYEATAYTRVEGGAILCVDNLPTEGRVGREMDVFVQIESGCTKYRSRLYTVPNCEDITPSGDRCAMTNIERGSYECNNDGTYNQQFTLYYENAPATGMIAVEINGMWSTYAIGTSPQTVTVNNLPANGRYTNVFAKFTDVEECTWYRRNHYRAPSGCNANREANSNLLGQREFNLFPNPSSGVLNLSVYNANGNGKAEVEIYNKLGQLVIRQTVTENEEHVLNLRQHPEGVYTVRVKGENYVETKKVVLKF